MPIKSQNGIPIQPQPLPSVTSQAVLVTADSVAIADTGGDSQVAVAISSASASVAATIESDSLDFPSFTQERTLWCWAACTKMVLNSLGQGNIPQCRIASTLLEQDCCDAACGKTCCNSDCSEDDVLTVYQAFGVEADFHDDTVSFTRLRREISENGLPVEVGIDWEGDNGGHLIVIRGWSRHQNVRRVKVRDPYYEDGEIRYSDLLNYKDGRWVFTWTGFRLAGD